MRVSKHLLLFFTVLLVVFSLSAVSAQASSIPITPENAAQVTEITHLEGHTGPVFSLAFSPDGSLLLSGGSGSDYTARLWDVASASERATLEGHTAQLAAVGFNLNGTQALTASYDGTIRTWDTSTNAALDTITQTDSGDTLFIENLLTFFSADGSKLIYGTDSGTGPFVVDLTTHTQSDASSVAPDMAYVAGVGISPDGKQGAFIDDQGNVHVYDSESLDEIALFVPTEPTEYGGAVAFSPDGKLLAVSNYDTSNIQIWNLATQDHGALLTGHTPNDDGSLTVNSLAFSPDGTLLASVSYDNTIRIWDVSAGEQLALLDVDQPAVVTFSPDGSHIASAGIDGVIHLWGIPQS